MSNIIPDETKRYVPRDPPWITKQINNLHNRKNRLSRHDKKHGYEIKDKDRMDTIHIECHQAEENAKLTYLENLGNKVNDPSTSQKSYWKIINRVLNKCRTPKILPSLVNNMFILNCCEKSKLFNDFLQNSARLSLIVVYYHLTTLLTDKNIDNISIERDEIIPFRWNT